MISQSTVETVTYNDWATASGTISHTVRRLVTPAVQVRGDQILVGVTYVSQSLYMILLHREKQEITLIAPRWQVWSWRTREEQAQHCNTGRRGCWGCVAVVLVVFKV